MSLILRQAKGSKLTIAEMDGNLSYLEQLATSNSGGNYEQNVSSQTTIYAGTTGGVAGVLITVGDGPVMITVTGDANPSSGAGGWVQLQLYRDKGSMNETALGHAIQAESSDLNENIPFALSFIDEPGAGSYLYTLEVIGCAGSDFVFGEVDGPVIYAVELKQGVFQESGNSVSNSNNSNAKGGTDNAIDNQSDSTIIGGEANCMCGNGNSWNIIAGGCDNYMYNVDGSAIVGGRRNCIESCADYSGILAGRCNRICGYDTYYNGIVGGTRNCINYGCDSGILAGCRNSICDYSGCSVIVGGRSNRIQDSDSSAIIAGCCHELNDSCYSAIVGGYYNYVCCYSCQTVVSGGCYNYAEINAISSTILGGNNNCVRGGNSYFGCGEVCDSSILAGESNCIHCEVTKSAIIGGCQNRICGERYCGSYWTNESVIVGGDNNTIRNSQSSVIMASRASSDNSIECSRSSAIIAHYGCGYGGTICCSDTSFILGGYGYYTYMCCAVGSGIMASYCGTICDSYNGSLISQYDSSILNANYASIIGGGNHVVAYSSSSIIAGGLGHEICGGSCASSIIGGQNNNIFNDSFGSSVIGGYNNTLNNSDNSVILGGNNLTLDGKANTALFCCLGTNYGGSNFFGLTSSDVTIAGTNLCIRNGLIVGIS